MGVDRAGVAIRRPPKYRCVRVKEHVDVVLDVGITGMAEADDLAVLDPEVALDDAQRRIDQHDALDAEVQFRLAPRRRWTTIPSRMLRPAPMSPSSPGGRGLAPRARAGRCRRGARGRPHGARRAVPRARCPSPGASSNESPLARARQHALSRQDRRPRRRRGPGSRGPPASRRSGGAERCASTTRRKAHREPRRTSSRRPNAASRSNSRALFTSKKWKCDVT